MRFTVSMNVESVGDNDDGEPEVLLTSGTCRLRLSIDDLRDAQWFGRRLFDDVTVEVTIDTTPKPAISEGSETP